LKFKGIDNLTLSREIASHYLVVEKSDVEAELLEMLESGEGDDDDLSTFGLDFAVTTDQGRKLGSVVEVIETGANLVWVVEGGELGQVLLPVIDECVLKLDKDQETAVVHLMKGLVDED
jgi:16S rRNA processing protein RimM